MDRKDIVIIVNFDDFVKLNRLEEYMRTAEVLFFDSSKPFAEDYRHDVLSIDLEHGKWAYRKDIFLIGNHGRGHRDEDILGVYDYTQFKHIQNIVDDVLDFGKRNRTRSWV